MALSPEDQQVLYERLLALFRAVVGLEDVARRHERARYQHDRYAPSCEQVREARCKVYEETNKLAKSGVIPTRTATAP